MSLTSYRAAPPRGDGLVIFEARRRPLGRWLAFVWFGRGRAGRLGLSVLLIFLFFAGLAATYSPVSFGQSTIGAEAFDGRVRDGIGSGRFARATRPAKDRKISPLLKGARSRKGLFGSRPSRRDGRRLMRAIKPIELLVPVSCTHCCASTPGLSTWSSSTALKGALVLRRVSRLDAFSGYPFHT